MRIPYQKIRLLLTLSRVADMRLDTDNSHRFGASIFSLFFTLVLLSNNEASNTIPNNSSSDDRQAGSSYSLQTEQDPSIDQRSPTENKTNEAFHLLNLTETNENSKELNGSLHGQTNIIQTDEEDTDRNWTVSAISSGTTRSLEDSTDSSTPINLENDSTSAWNCSWNSTENEVRNSSIGAVKNESCGTATANTSNDLHTTPHTSPTTQPVSHSSQSSAVHKGIHKDRALHIHHRFDDHNFTRLVFTEDSKSPSLVASGVVASKDVGKEFASCSRPAKCRPLNQTLCLGATLFYKQTSPSLVNESLSEWEIRAHLQRWEGLRNVPKCWAVVQTLLCAIYFPRCDNGMVDLPSQDMCRITRGPCRIVESTLKWPKHLDCTNEKNFPALNCKTEARELRFNTASWCRPPLVVTDVASNWYEGWEGCGLQCHNPLFTKEEHQKIHAFISIVGCLSLFCSLFTVLTFVIDWKSANKYPALIIFYVNWCFLIANIGFLAQFTPGARDDIICRRDGTLRKLEPTSGENLSCVIVFVMVYYFLMASVVWFVILTYSWYVSFKALGKIRETIDAKTAYFHLVAWSVPLVLTIVILALAQVDGDSVSGICFVGHVNQFMRIGFVLIPVTVSLIAGEFYLIRGLIVLVRLKIGSDDIISVKASAKLRETIVRLALFAGLAFLFVFVTYVCHLYEYTHQNEWDQSLRRYVACKSNLTLGDYTWAQSPLALPHCPLPNRPSISGIQIHLLAFFGAGIVMSTWVWTSSTLDAWKRFLRRAFKQPINEPVKLTKHKMIAKAFAKRRDTDVGRLSFSFQSTHDDPLGMNFELNSGASQEISSTWQAALPKFITRRGALMGARDLGLRRNSSASDLSQRPPSLDSHCTRRHSLDSQISFHMSEHERQAYMARERQQRRRKKKEFRRRGRNVRVVPSRGLAKFQRRGSDISQHSDFGHIIPHQLMSIEKVNNLEKEQAQIARPGTGFTKPMLASLQIPELLFGRARNGSCGSSASEQQKQGRSNFGFVQDDSDSSSVMAGDQNNKPSASHLALPGQVVGSENVERAGASTAVISAVPPPPKPSASRGRSFSFGGGGVEDAGSGISTDNESLHRLGEQLSSNILVRAIRDSQSDLEMKSLAPSRCSHQSFRLSQQGSSRSRKSEPCPVGEVALNNTGASCRSTIVDMAMDSDNRDSSSS